MVGVINVVGDKLSTKNYWDSTYGSRGRLKPVSVEGYKNRCTKMILSKKLPLIASANSILEVGGGGSAWLAYLANKYPHKQFTSLDFSETGNALLRAYAADNSLYNLKAVEGDFFSNYLDGIKFDLVYSHGVVEHFQDLSGVLSAHGRFLSERGEMLTIIPNMAGILGFLTEKMNKEVYDIHVPHDLASFEKGHKEAGLNIIESGYLCSNNFGVLSSCIKKNTGFMYSFYKQLTRITKLVWLFEDKVFELPISKLFSPYIYAVSEKV